MSDLLSSRGFFPGVRHRPSLRIPAVLPAAVLAGAAALLGGCAAPEELEKPILADDIPHTFLALDEDGDGRLTRIETAPAPRLLERFARADANNDGVLDRYEFNSPGWRPFPTEPGETAPIGIDVHASAGGPRPGIDADTVIGLPVYHAATGSEGRVEDLVLDLTHGRVHFAVVDIRGQRLSVPLDWLQMPGGRGYATLQTIQDPSIPPVPGMRLVHATEMLGRPVVDATGAPLGTLSRIALAPETAQVLYAVVRSKDPGRASLRVPLAEIEMPVLRQVLVLRQAPDTAAAGATAVPRQ